MPLPTLNLEQQARATKLLELLRDNQEYCEACKACQLDVDTELAATESAMRVVEGILEKFGRKE